MKIKTHNTAGCFLTRSVNNRLQLLLIFKRWPGKLEGWMPPKGHVEENETDEAAALRETTEETGYVNIASRGFIKTVNIEYPWDDGYIHKKTIHWFHAELIDDKRKKKELSVDEQTSTVKQEWFDIDEALRVMKFEDEREVLGYFKAVAKI